MIFHGRRSRRKNCANDKTVSLKAPQRLCQHSLRNVIDGSAQLSEAIGALCECEDEQETPFVADTIKDIPDRTTAMRFCL